MTDQLSDEQSNHDELAAALLRPDAIIEHSDDAIIGLTPAGIIVTWNPGAERLFGYTRDEIVGKPISTLAPPDRNDEVPQILRVVNTGERVDHFETVRVRKDGSRLNVSLTISGIRDADGNIIGLSKIARDVTANKRIERELAELLEREQEARNQAQRESRLKDEFLATLSHELRTPLNAILGWSHLLRTEKLEPKQVLNAYETLERNARVQAQMIDDLLDMSRIVAGTIRLDVQEMDLAATIMAAIDAVRPAAEAKSIQLIPMLDPRVNHVRGDPSRLQQVVWNLLSNAVKFTPRGGRVQVFLERVNSHLEITVSDNGIGIEPDFLPYVFDRFRQADASSTRRHGGLGIGLNIVRQLVELHGGTVTVKSRGENQGTTFTVNLPLTAVQGEPSDPSRLHPLTGHSAHPETPSLAGIHVLVVDDDPDGCELMKAILDTNGASVTLASSAAEAMTVIEQAPPKVIVSDIGMPGEDGYALIRRIRALPTERGGRIPAIAITAFARPADRTRALLSGFQQHLAKPVEPSELIAAVASAANISIRD